MQDLVGDGFLSKRTREAGIHYKVIQNYDLAFDIGVNVGGFSNAYHDKFKKIVAVEAHPSTFEFAKSNLSRYPHIEVINKAVSNEDDKELNLFPDKNGDSGSTSVFNLQNGKQICDTEARVKTITYNSLVEKYGVPQYLKIDCEGGEYDFLINQDLSGVEFIAIEIHYGYLTRAQRKELMAHLLKSFKIYARQFGVPFIRHPEYNLIRK